MNLKPILLTLLLASTGCQYADMRDHMDEGSALEKQGRKAQRSERYAEAAEFYAQSAVKLEYAFNIARERETMVFVSHVGTQLAIVFAGQAFCTQANNDKQGGDWQRAYELYATSGTWGQEVSMLKLVRNAKHMQAFCVRPDNNPQGSWEKAGELYAKGVEIAKECKNDEDRGEGLREQALCLMEGDPTRIGASLEARKLLVKARKLGDEGAADLLAEAKQPFCNACGSALQPGAQFCTQCGQNQTVKTKPKPQNSAGMKAPGEPSPGPSR